MKKILLIISSVIIILALYYFFGLRNNREDKLIKEGNELVNKVDKYQVTNGRLPDSLAQIGIKETENYPLYYNKRDSNHYMIWFGTSLGESKTYYSDSKKWEDFQR